MMEKTALITGASGGIGRALCQIFKEAEYLVIGLDKIKENNEICDVFIEADLQKMCLSKAYCLQILEQIQNYLSNKNFEVLVNNAAIQIVKPTKEITVDDWHQTLNVNLIAPFILTQGLLSELEKASGSVVNIASIHATLTKPKFICYATSKTALVGLTKSMAVELGSRVRVNAICPAAVATPMLVEGFKGKEELLAQLSGMHPVGRIAKPEEVAEAALFLTSSQAKFINGALLELDGGISSRLHDPI
jgi:NAD(P)-dependent dehydrogenase (short-subunit alcohol dehydrogenase family)